MKSLCDFVDESSMTKGNNGGLYHKPVSISDWAFLATVLRSAHIQYEPFMDQAFMNLALKYEIKGPPDHQEYFILYSHDVAIGFMGLEALSPHTLYLVGLYLLDDYQGRGWGTYYIEHLEKWARAMGYRNICLQAHVNAPWALGFYKHLNYEALDVISEKSLLGHSIMTLFQTKAIKNTLIFVKVLE